jgi:hypothetical protein
MQCNIFGCCKVVHQFASINHFKHQLKKLSGSRVQPSLKKRYRIVTNHVRLLGIQNVVPNATTIEIKLMEARRPRLQNLSVLQHQFASISHFKHEIFSTIQINVSKDADIVLTPFRSSITTRTVIGESLKPSTGLVNSQSHHHTQAASTLQKDKTRC